MGHSTVLIIWGNACDPFMQLLHFAFGLGGVLGPLILRLVKKMLKYSYPGQLNVIVSPFLVNLENEDGTNHSSAAENAFVSENLRIQTAYQIVSVFMVCVSIPFFYIYLRHRITLEHPSRMTACGSSSNVHQLNAKTYKIVVIVSTAFVTVYNGLEIAMASFLTTFAHTSDLKLPKAVGATMTSVYWSTYAVFQLLTVFYTNTVGPEKNIILLLIVTLIANCFLVPFGNTYVWCLWTGAAIMGIGLSALWGSIFGYLENYFPIVRYDRRFGICEYFFRHLQPTFIRRPTKLLPFLQFFPVSVNWSFLRLWDRLSMKRRRYFFG